MIGIQPIDQYARDISDEKQHSVIDGASAGTDKRYYVLHKDYPDPDALRKLAASIKDHTLHHLGDYLAKAEKSLTDRGVSVHFASTDEDARQTILSILRGHEVTQLTKSKSMAAEEIHGGTGRHHRCELRLLRHRPPDPRHQRRQLALRHGSGGRAHRAGRHRENHPAGKGPRGFPQLVRPLRHRPAAHRLHRVHQRPALSEPTGRTRSHAR